MPKRSFSLLDYDEDHVHKFAPSLRLELVASRHKALKLGKLPVEVREMIHRHLFTVEVRPAYPMHPKSATPCTAVRTDAQVKGPSFDALGQSFDTGRVLDPTLPIRLYRFPVTHLAEVEAYVYNHCTLKLTCNEDKLWPRQEGVLKRGKRLSITFDGRPTIFRNNIWPLLAKRTDLKYLRINFASWPSYRVWGQDVAQLLERKLAFLGEIKVNRAVVEANASADAKHTVLQRLADAMMSETSVESPEATRGIPVVRNMPVDVQASTTKRTKREPGRP